jgi:prepilin-type N-terminal cleavage/methylation domain-containing protein
VISGQEVGIMLIDSRSSSAAFYPNEVPRILQRHQMKAITNVSKAKSRRGFTLVEMLVVISMIAALAGVSFPVYRSIQAKVERQRIQMMYTSIERAVDNFETEYNYMPHCEAAYPAGDSQYYWLNSQSSQFLGILMGLESSKNFKKIKFLEIDEAEGSGPGSTTDKGPHGYRNGVKISGVYATLYSPYGMHYAFRLDLNGDGEIANCRIGWNGGVTDPMVTGKKIALHTVSGSIWAKDYFVTNFD